MQYLGGKTRIAKKLVAAMAPYARGRTVWEPFCGGLCISGPLSQVCTVVATDANPALIALYTAVARGWAPPESLSEDEYAAARMLPDSDPLKAFAGFGCSFGGKWFGGYARSPENPARNYAAACGRAIKRDVGALVSRGGVIACVDFLEVVPFACNFWIYADPPYRGTVEYKGGTAFRSRAILRTGAPLGAVHRRFRFGIQHAVRASRAPAFAKHLDRWQGLYRRRQNRAPLPLRARCTVSLPEALRAFAVREVVSTPRVPMHSSANDRWFTPEHIVAAGRAALGGTVDLDPASEELANTVVHASRIITAAEDGLAAPWRLPGQAPVTVFCNPPGGITADRKSLAGQFWIRLMREREAGNIESAVFVAFNLELLQSTQTASKAAGVPPLGSFLVCVPRGRVRYWAPEGRKMSSPTHGSVIGYVPGTVDRSRAFVDAFCEIGSIMVGVPTGTKGETR